MAGRALYRAAGADCLFVPGVRDAATIAALMPARAVPSNILAGRGASSIVPRGQLGVARVRLGLALAQVELTTTERVAQELLAQGPITSWSSACPLAL